ncbi:MAG: translation initiation factor eIF-1A, partial [Nanoarchaeota archaeon]
LRVKLPREKELIGVIEQRLGGNKMMVLCSDGKSRNCRIPGRLKRNLWLRPGDFVIIQTWEFDADKADVIFKYTPTAIQWLRENGWLKNLEQF